MKYSEQEIIDAVKIIKETCTEHACDRCPFSVSGVDCVINDKSPANWRIKDPSRFKVFQ